MISINPLFQVLVTGGNLAVAAAGLTPAQLQVGQIGVFSYATNLSIDGTVLSQNRKFYLAVGVNRIGTNVTQDITKSAGEAIDLVGIRAFSIKPYAAPVQQKLLLTIPASALSCNTEYGIKFEVHNAAAYANFGYNTPYLPFFATTPCCSDPCTQCGGGDANALIQGFAAAIANDPNSIFTTQFIDPTSGDVIPNPADWLAGDSNATPVITSATPATTGGTLAAGTLHYALQDITSAGYSALSTDVSATTTGTTGEVAFVYPAAPDSVTERRLYIGTASGTYTKYVDVPLTGPYTYAGGGEVTAAPHAATSNTGEVMQLAITVNTEALYSYALINLKYDFPRGTIVVPSMIEGFQCGGTLVQTQAVVYEEGAGYDIQEKEYEAGGWNGKPGVYRISELIGTEVGNFETFATPLGKYQQYAIMNENRGIGGGAKYDSSMMTLIAVPSTDTNTIPSLSAILHRIIDGVTGNDSTVNGLFTPEFSEVFE